MRKAIDTLIMIGMLSLAASASDLRSDSEVRLLETALPAMTSFSLAILDLLPEPAPKAAFVAMNLDPSQVAINPGHRYLTHSQNGSAFPDTIFDASMVGMIVLNVADYLSTNAALKYPGLAESNPVSKLFEKNPYVFAAFKLGFTAFSYWGIKRLYKQKKTLAWFLSTATNFALSYAVFNNVRLINTVKGR